MLLLAVIARRAISLADGGLSVSEQKRGEVALSIQDVTQTPVWFQKYKMEIKLAYKQAYDMK